VVAQVHPEQRRHLVVPRAPGPQQTTQLGTEPIQQTVLQRGVHIFVSFSRQELPGQDVLEQPVQTGQHRGQILVGQQSRAVQHLGVRLRPGNVVRRQPPVELRRLTQRRQRVCRSAGEPATP